MLCYRAPELFSVPDFSRSDMPVPTPFPENSHLLTRLGDLVRQSASDTSSGGRSGTGQFVKGFSVGSNEIKNFQHSPDFSTSRSLFPESKTIPQVQRSLYSINTAKSFAYSSNFFGLKKYYGDEFNFKLAPLHPADRRKIRFGLKSIVDFVIQLDVQNIMTYLRSPNSMIKDFGD